MSPSIPATFDDARPILTARPVGRTPLGIRALRLSLAGAVSALDATVAVAEDTLVGLFLDLPDADVAVSETMLRGWGVSLEQALQTTLQQHGGDSPRIQPIEGAFLIQDRSFAAYLLQHPAVAARLVGGRVPVIVVPTQGALVLAPADDAAAVLVAARVADRVLQQDDQLVSATPLAHIAGRWVSFEWPAAASSTAATLRRRFASKAYGAQRPLLKTHFDRTHQDVFVTEAMFVGRPDGTTQLVTSLTENTASVLPWVDTVALVRMSDSAVTYVPMMQLMQMPGLLTRMPDLEPAVYYPTRFPAELTR